MSPESLNPMQPNAPETAQALLERVQRQHDELCTAVQGDSALPRPGSSAAASPRGGRSGAAFSSLTLLRPGGLAAAAAAAGGCLVVGAGVDAIQDHLRALADQQVSRDACVGGLK